MLNIQIVLNSNTIYNYYNLLSVTSDTCQKELSHKKSPGYDVLTGQIMKELPWEGIIMATQLFNAVLGLKYFSAQWKVAEVILIHKPGKPPVAEVILVHKPGKLPSKVTGYRPISSLPLMSKPWKYC